MAPWNELLDQFTQQPSDVQRGVWIEQQLAQALDQVSKRRHDRNVILYNSAFLQKPQVPPDRLQITHEDLNGLMSVMYGMDWPAGLTLILHTPGGVTTAAETLVEYLRSKFNYVEVIIPTLSMSAGTMMSLAADRIVMGRQSQMGPIDPQMPVIGRTVSARAIVDQFDRAKTEVKQDISNAHVWAAILQSLGPALLQEAQNALDYGESMVARWLARYMFRDRGNAEELGKRVAAHFNDASLHKSHGRRIDRDEARNVGVIIEDLEDDQGLQDAVLTTYHVTTITAENSPMTKFMASNHGRRFVKNLPVLAPTAIPPQAGRPATQP